MVKAIVFDFDGTIIPGSEALKQQGYSMVFSDYGEKVPEMEIKQAQDKFSKGNGTRFEILQGIFEQLSYNAETITKKVAEYVERYDEVVKTHTLKLGVPQSHREAITRLSKQYPLYLNSIAPENSLQWIVIKLGIAELFRGILGKPLSKLENLKIIAEREGIDPKQIVFVGDDEGDKKAADDFGCRFIGFSNSLNKWTKAEKLFTVINDLSELEQHI